MLEVGTVIDGKYKILSVIGRGGMSTVYLAINEKANKPWAIKEVRKDIETEFEIVRQSLLTEKEMLKKLSHKGVPSIIDVIEDDDNFLIVMDYIEGTTLKSILEEQGAQPQAVIVDWAIQLCEVLQYLHHMTPSIIYRDMKPANIMLCSDGNLVLIDFGTAREYKEKNSADTTYLGTQGYAAPEQFGGLGQTDARTDIYTLGSTMYHLLTGHNPSEPPYEMYPITRWNSNLSDGLEHIICKCTQPNPQKRFQSADELLYALKHYKDLEQSAVVSYKRRMCAFCTSLILAVIMLILSFAMGITADREQKSEYEYLIGVADKSSDFDTKMEYYLKAIATDTARSDAYQKLVESFENDGVFTDAEENALIRLSISVDEHLNKFERDNPGEYADFCYSVGNMYWFYYEHKESRQSNAVKWFEAAMNYYNDNEEKNMEWKRSRLYVEMGSFYKNVILSSTKSNNRKVYLEYWNDLLELKSLNDINPDRDMITLRLYKEIISRTMEYAGFLFEEGVTNEEINKLFESIKSDMNRMEVQAGSTIYEEIVQIHKLLAIAEEMTDAIDAAQRRSIK